MMALLMIRLEKDVEQRAKKERAKKETNGPLMIKLAKGRLAVRVKMEIMELVKNIVKRRVQRG